MTKKRSLDSYSDKHEAYLQLLTGVRVSFDKGADLFSLFFQTKGSLPPVWLMRLRIDLRHDTRPVQETVAVEWPDVEGSTVVATCPRPRIILPDEEVSETGESFLPVGHVILFAGYGGHKRILPNATSVRAFRARPMCPTSEDED